MQEACRGRAESGKGWRGSVEVGIARFRSQYSVKERDRMICARVSAVDRGCLVRFELKSPPCCDSFVHGTGARYRNKEQGTRPAFTVSSKALNS